MAWTVYEELIETRFYLNWQETYLDFPQIDNFNSTDDESKSEESSNEVEDDEKSVESESSSLEVYKNKKKSKKRKRNNKNKNKIIKKTIKRQKTNFEQ